MKSHTVFDDVTALENLAAAWKRERKKKSAPGIDEMTVERFAPGVDHHLRELRSELRRGVYRPLPLRRTFIPKLHSHSPSPSGGGGQGVGWRSIAIPALRDRLAQRACLNVLGPLLEPHFEECSFAYRERRSIYQAIACVQDWHYDGLPFVLQGDIDECYDSIDRDLVLVCLSQYVNETPVLDLVRLWLECGVMMGGRVHFPPRGIPQGDVISPLLCNVLLDELDEAMLARRFHFVRYADDLIVVGAKRERVESARSFVAETLASLDLRLDEGKTGITTFDGGFKYLGTIFQGELVLPTVRKAIVSGDGEERVIFVPGYPEPVRPPRGEPGAARIDREHQRATASITTPGARSPVHPLTRSLTWQPPRTRAKVYEHLRLSSPREYDKLLRALKELRGGSRQRPSEQPRRDDSFLV